MPKHRYARQTILKEVGPQGQQRLLNAKVLIVGVGGLGSPAALYLAAAGVGTLGLVDDDCIDLSNLQRQILFTTAEQGQAKVEKGAERLRALNPETNILVFQKRLQADNALQLLDSYDVVIDGSDNFSTKYLLNDAAVKLGKPLVFGALSRWEGRAAVFWSPHGPCYRCLFPHPPTDHIPNCAEAGVMGALAGIIGSLQALEAIKILLAGSPPYDDKNDLHPLIGYLWLLRATNFESQRIKVSRNLDCPLCSKSPKTIELHDLEVPRCVLNSSYQELSSDELDTNGKWQTYQWIDVREKAEWEQGHLPGARHWPLSLMQKGMWPDQTLDQRPLLLYCHGGSRSRVALGLWKRADWVPMGHLKDGLQSWRGPITTPPGD